MEYQMDIIVDVQNRSLEAIQSSEDLEFIWNMRLAEMIERLTTGKSVIYALYVLMTKYGANGISENIRHNEYKISLSFQQLSHSHSFIIKP